MAGLTRIKSDGIGDDCDLDGEGTLVLDSTNNRVGIGTASPSNALVVREAVDANDSAYIEIVSGNNASAGVLFSDTDAATRAGVLYSHGDEALRFFRSGFNEAVRIDSSGRVGIGTTSPGSNYILDVAGAARFSGGNGYVSFGDNGYIRTNAANELRFQNGTSGTTFYQSGLASEFAKIDDIGRLLVGTSTWSVGSDKFVFAGNTVNNNESVLSIARINAPSTNDNLGLVRFHGQGNNTEAARISVLRDGGTWTSGSSHPGRLVFSTTANGSSSPTERMRISQSGQVQITQDSSNIAALYVYCENASYASTVKILRTVRGNNSAFAFLRNQSNNGSDNEHVLRGDGNAYADGSWNGGGADYAEYFEWSDSNPDAENRRGISVVLDGDKIREAVAGEEPIGVISGNPSVVGDAAWNKWDGKYLRDDFGTYVRNEEGERQLNPAYDPEVEYINREDRPEWDCVGLMGKLRIRKGQPTGSRWIKMRDISDSVEEWLVR